MFAKTAEATSPARPEMQVMPTMSTPKYLAAGVVRGWGSDGNVYNVLRGLRDVCKPSGA